MDYFNPEKVIKDLKARNKETPSKEKRITKFECNKCQDRGIYMEGEFAVPCQCVKRRSLENKFKNCQIPKSMLKHSFTILI